MNGSQSSVFVLGTPRSGTTLTARLLGNLSNLFMPGETHFFDDISADARDFDRVLDENTRQRILDRLKSSYGRFGETEDQQRVDRLVRDGTFETALSACRTEKAIFVAFMEIQAAQGSKARWGNHVPKDVFEVDTILKMFPDARIIGCIRDPRDFFVSYRDYWRASSTETFAKQIRGLYHPVVTALLWKATARALLKAADDHRDVMVISRYEDLISDTPGRIAMLCAHIGEPFEPAATDTNYNNSSVHTRTSGVHAMSIGRWREQLPPEDVAIAQLLCGREMERLGYPRETVDASPALVLLKFASTPLGLLRALRLKAPTGVLSASYMASRLRFLLRGART